MTALTSFGSEKEAQTYLKALLRNHFTLQPEVRIRHLEAGNYLRVDFLVKQWPEVEPGSKFRFPFPWFAIEVKKSCAKTSHYNTAIRQATDYTHCVIDDDRPTLERINGQRIERVYIFPGRGPDRSFCDDATGKWHATKDCSLGFCLNRLAGKFHVGMIYETPEGPAFFCSADRQWDPVHGAIQRKHNSRQTVGNGALRRDANRQSEHGSFDDPAFRQRQARGQALSPRPQDGRDPKIRLRQ